MRSGRRTRQAVVLGQRPTPTRQTSSARWMRFESPGGRRAAVIGSTCRSSSCRDAQAVLGSCARARRALRVGGRHRVEAVEQRLEVSIVPPTSSGRVRARGSRRSSALRRRQARRRVALRRVGMTSIRWCGTRALGGTRLGGSDVHAAVDEGRVDADDLHRPRRRGQGLGDGERRRRLLPLAVGAREAEPGQRSRHRRCGRRAGHWSVTMQAHEGPRDDRGGGAERPSPSPAAASSGLAWRRAPVRRRTRWPSSRSPTAAAARPRSGTRARHAGGGAGLVDAVPGAVQPARAGITVPPSAGRRTRPRPAARRRPG